ncbi:MAG: hypothetical protein NC038_04470 [Paludibacter sp.]|nr:hypothetical protein [Bacteroidales bacterium]MCM1069388.1 hypothetical protein [Prevotella sp.]MCM1353908.1 hypothetical protein [Bacteroides sp.]MCM1442842.1 hypothetical protein [Muribaculum sp.]MCM1481887.1 hypothetical protein [Paludibacter sp.]
MKKLSIYLLAITLFVIFHSCNSVDDYYRFKILTYPCVGTLDYGVNPYNTSDSCLYFHPDPDKSFYKEKDYVLIQNNNALISIFDTLGNKFDSIPIYLYNLIDESKINPLQIFPALCPSDRRWLFAQIHMRNCPESYRLLFDSAYYCSHNLCIHNKIEIETGSTELFSDSSSYVPFQKEIDGKIYHFMKIMDVGPVKE